LILDSSARKNDNALFGCGSLERRVSTRQSPLVKKNWVLAAVKLIFRRWAASSVF
jgi:hypothetical protein